MPEDQCQYTIATMRRWRQEAERWADEFDARLAAETNTEDELLMLSDYFLFTAGSVYYYANELERVRRGVDTRNPLTAYKNVRPLLKSLVDRRDHVAHGYLDKMDERDHCYREGTRDFKKVRTMNWEGRVPVGEWQRDVLPLLDELIDVVLAGTLP